MYYPQLPVGAFIAAALVLFPLPSYWRSKNVATLSLILWLFLMNLIYGLNSLVWADNASPRWLVWCDISGSSLLWISFLYVSLTRFWVRLTATKLMIGASHAIPAAAMCVCKHLELVASGRVVRLTHDEQRQRKFLELFMCFGLPIILMALRAFLFYIPCSHNVNKHFQIIWFKVIDSI